MKKFLLVKKISILFIPTLLLIIIFFTAGGADASASSGDLDNMKNYESVLIKDGDTLSSIARQYASDMSHFSEQEYLESIISLNNLDSDYIVAGHYLLLPRFV